MKVISSVWSLPMIKKKVNITRSKRGTNMVC